MTSELELTLARARQELWNAIAATHLALTNLEERLWEEHRHTEAHRREVRAAIAAGEPDADTEALR